MNDSFSSSNDTPDKSDHKDHRKEPAPSISEGIEIEDPRPKGKLWMYRSLHFGPLKIPCVASVSFQVTFVSLASFLCPGMFNAINGLGGGGQVNARDINNANTTLYCLFAVVGFFAGSIVNTIGLRLALLLGGLGYPIFVASLLVYNHTENTGFLIFAGGLLGISAALFWTAQGTVMISYPAEEKKGRTISLFWIVFNLGAVIGGLIPLAQNMHSSTSSVNDGTYIGFIVLSTLGLALSAFLCNPSLVRREDGSQIILMKNPTWKTEIKGLFHTLRTDWYIVFLFPMFFASNWFYTYHFQGVNLPVFNIRTRALNSVLYFGAQMVGASIFGTMLDNKRWRRSMRARGAAVVLFLLTMGIWSGGYEFQKTYTREQMEAHPELKLDWTSSGYIGPMFLYIAYGIYDSAWQTYCYWLMGAMTNNSRKLAIFAGFYKGMQSAGAAIAPQLDAKRVSYMAQMLTCWGLLAFSLLFASPIIWTRTMDHSDIDEDLKFSDEIPRELRGGSHHQRYLIRGRKCQFLTNLGRKLPSKHFS
ncbi:major facilitator superfamily domain-containing protein [Penicillium brevicompactum]|uniref:Major facilitator superfamily domain-containing protein n=1 Tax=Penicillium brevicompactum TaxID=5074 RepID=A0A9W9R2M6_PENBR|nr:major facilitator superfamily domain-containing protein [Penicillium brevicompactum]